MTHRYRIGWMEYDASLYVTVRAESAVEAKELAQKVAKRELGRNPRIERLPETKGPSVEDFFRNGKILQELWVRQVDSEFIRQQLRRLEALEEVLRTYLVWRNTDVRE